MPPTPPSKSQRLVLTFRSLAKAKRAWELLWLLQSALKVFPDDFWVHYNSERPREIVFGIGEWPQHAAARESVVSGGLIREVQKRPACGQAYHDDIGRSSVCCERPQGHSGSHRCGQATW